MFHIAIVGLQQDDFSQQFFLYKQAESVSLSLFDNPSSDELHYSGILTFLASIPYRDTGRNKLQMWWRRRVWPWGLHHRRRRSAQGFELYKIFIFHFASNFLSLVQIRGLHLYTTIRGHAMHGYILSISPQNAIKKVKMGNGQSRYWCTSMSLSACLWSTTTNHCFSPTSIPGWCDCLQER